MPTRPLDDSYDVLVAGGGPAGGTAAALIAEAGHRVLLAERSPEPRFKVGESLMPASYWTFERLGVLDKMKKSAFPAKYSVQFFTADGRGTSPFYFHENDPHESSQTWQVLRSEFDQMLLDNAADKGAEVRRGLAVRDVVFDGERAVGAVVGEEGGASRRIDARVIVDATGQRALISSALGLKQSEPCLRNVSYYTHFEGGWRGTGRDAGATLILHTGDKKSWFWFIPVPDGRVSVGVVGQVDHLAKGRSGTPQEIFEEELAICPALAERLEGATQVMEMKVIRDFSYRSQKMAGDGWVTAGDAYGFIDPIYSTGVFLALKSGELAADAVIEGLAKGDLSAASLGRFEAEYAAGLSAFKQLVYAFYNPHFSFSELLERYPHVRKDLINMLVGNIFREPVDDLLTALAEMQPLPEPAQATA